MARHNLVYSAPSGLEVTPYRGNITDVAADAAVTREDTSFQNESLVTKALQAKYPKLKDSRDTFMKKTNFLFFKNVSPFNPWTVKVSTLSKSSGSEFIVFHAIMNQPVKEEANKAWGDNMTKMYTSLLHKAETLKVKVLAVPLLGSVQNAKTATKVLVDVILSHNPKNLKHIYVVSKGNQDILEVIVYCRDKMVLVRGNQPEGGTMAARKENGHLPGYDTCGTIEVTYYFSDGKQGNEHPNPDKPYKGTKRHAYLPDCSDGRKVLGLLKTAFDDRMLTFTIGYSKTTHERNVVKFTGIPLKTSRDGGPKRYGYPDPSYLNTVQEYLRKRGITKGQHVDIRCSSGRAPSAAQKKRHFTAPAGPPRNQQEQATTPRRHGTVPTPIRQPDLVAPIGRAQVDSAESREVREDIGRGNCMFVSLSRQIKRVLHQDIGHLDLRTKLVQYLRDNPNQPNNTPYSDFLEDESWEEFLERMSRDGQWGDHLILQAAAELYTVQIVVEKDKTEPMSVTPSSPWSEQLLLRLSGGRHYESIE